MAKELLKGEISISNKSSAELTELEKQLEKISAEAVKAGEALNSIHKLAPAQTSFSGDMNRMMSGRRYNKLPKDLRESMQQATLNQSVKANALKQNNEAMQADMIKNAFDLKAKNLDRESVVKNKSADRTQAADEKIRVASAKSEAKAADFAAKAKYEEGRESRRVAAANRKVRASMSAKSMKEAGAAFESKKRAEKLAYTKEMNAEKEAHSAKMRSGRLEESGTRHYQWVEKQKIKGENKIQATQLANANATNLMEKKDVLKARDLDRRGAHRTSGLEERNRMHLKDIEDSAKLRRDLQNGFKGIDRITKLNHMGQKERYWTDKKESFKKQADELAWKMNTDKKARTRGNEFRYNWLRTKESAAGSMAEGGGGIGGLTNLMLRPKFLALALAIGLAIKGLAKFTAYLFKTGAEQMDKWVNIRNKLTMSGRQFGIDPNNEKQKSDFMKKAYKDMRDMFHNGMNGEKVVNDAIAMVHQFGTKQNDPNGFFRDYEDALNISKSINAFAQMGGVGQQELDSFTYQLGQVFSKGYAELQDVRPMLNSSPSMMAKFKEYYGLSSADMLDMASNKSLTADMFRKFLEDYQRQYELFMKDENHQTFATQEANGKSQLDAVLGDPGGSWFKLMEELKNNKIVTVWYEGLSDILKIITDFFASDPKGKADGILYATAVALSVIGGIVSFILIIIEMIKIVAKLVIVFWGGMASLIELLFKLFLNGILGVIAFVIEGAITVGHWFSLLFTDIKVMIMGLINALIQEFPRISEFFGISAEESQKAQNERTEEAIAKHAEFSKRDTVEETKKRVDAMNDALPEWLAPMRVGADGKREMNILAWDFTKHFAENSLGGSFKDLSKDMGEAYLFQEGIWGQGGKVDFGLGRSPSVANDIKDDTAAIKKNTDGSGKKLKEILTEIAGYEVINRVTRIRPDITMNFGSIRDEGLKPDEIIAKLKNGLKSAEESLTIGNNQGVTETIVTPRSLVNS